MFHWFASGEQARPVKSPEEPAEFRNMRRFVRVTSWTARPTEEVGTSATASTPSTSSQLRTSCAPMSGRFWWSAETISTGRPRTEPPKSSTAMRAARTEPAPEMSATKPDMSLSTPILTPPRSWPRPGLVQAAEVIATAAADVNTILRFIPGPPRFELGSPRDPGAGADVFRWGWPRRSAPPPRQG